MVKSDEPLIRYIKISGSSLRWRLGSFCEARARIYDT